MKNKCVTPPARYQEEKEKAKTLRSSLDMLQTDLEDEIRTADECGVDLAFYARFMRKLANELEAV